MNDPLIFDLEKVQSLRQSALEATKMPNGFDRDGRWVKSEEDPGKLVRVFNELRVKKGFTLAAYQWKGDIGGYGVIWAMPEGVELPEPNSCPMSSFRREQLTRPGIFDEECPRPPGALTLMESIQGDNTPWSYLSASILAREAGEFGAWWHRCLWSTHKILEVWPLETKMSVAAKSAGFQWPPSRDWHWIEPEPSEWRPQVTEDNQKIIVTFYTYCRHHRESLFKHEDTYTRGNYDFNSATRLICEGPWGYDF